MAEFRNFGHQTRVQATKKSSTGKVFVDYRDTEMLRRILTPNGKIDVARRTGASRKQQHRVSQAIKRARFLALLPYDRDPGDNVRPRGDFRPRDRGDRDRGDRGERS